MSEEVYRKELDTILSLQFTHAPLSEELSSLYPQLFDASATPAVVRRSGSLAEQEERHKQLHTMHVMPVVKGLESQQSGEMISMHCPSPQVFNPAPISSWNDFYQTLDDCLRQNPLHFPHTVSGWALRNSVIFLYALCSNCTQLYAPMYFSKNVFL